MLTGMEERRARRPLWHYGLVAAGIAVVTGAVLLLMGRVPVSESGRVLLWVGTVHGPENSQQVFDWYSFSHVIHGAAFYGLTRIAMPSASLGLRLIVSTMLEAAWEVYENTDTVVERYRAATIAVGYYGDSILNSVADVFACLAGFALAWRLPRKATIAWAVVVEIVRRWPNAESIPDAALDLRQWVFSRDLPDRSEVLPPVGSSEFHKLRDSR